MARITSIKGRLLYNSRGSRSLEVDVIADEKHIGRVCAPSGASVGKHEAVSFPENKPEKSLHILRKNAKKFFGIDPADLKTIHETLREIDSTSDYSKVGGSLAFAVTIASVDAASRSTGIPMFKMLSSDSIFRFPFPLGNILGGGAHAGQGTPDIQEILVCAVGSKNIQDAIEVNLSVHKELGRILAKKDPTFTNGRGDEGGWAPKLDNDEALELSAKACEDLGFTLGKEVSLGVDFASTTQWSEKEKKYLYNRAGFENTREEQIDFASEIIKKYKLVYAEDAVHEEAFQDMANLTKKFPKVLITGDDLLVTNAKILEKAAKIRACNAAILKVNQAGSLYDALEFAKAANKNKIKLITSHRSGESNDSHISHIGIATKSKMLKVGIVGGERIAKLNELLRLSEHDLIRGMVEI